MDTGSVKWSGVVARVVFALVLVFLTWNPDGFSYWEWAIAPVFSRGGGLSAIGPLQVLGGIVLLMGWFVALQATRRSLGLIGALLTAGLAACVIWLLIDWHVVSARSTKGVARAALIVLGILLGIGLSWSLLRGRLTGQVTTDEEA